MKELWAALDAIQYERDAQEVARRVAAARRLIDGVAPAALEGARDGMGSRFSVTPHTSGRRS